MTDFQNVDRVLREAISARVFPGASVEVGTAEGPVWRAAAGALTYEADAARTTHDTIFDLASLTKVLATASVALRLQAAGRLDIDQRVAHYLPGWVGSDRQDVRVRDLLEHASGLPAWMPLSRTCRGFEAFMSAIADIPLEQAPRTRSVYSDLGFMLAGFIIETAGGAPLDELFDRCLRVVMDGNHAQPLTFTPPASWRARTAPTRFDEMRDRLLVGDVDDSNAWALGGVAGHAGLFGTAGAVGAVARRVLLDFDPGSADATRVWRADLLRAWCTRSRVPGSSRALAWDTMLPTSSCGVLMSPGSIGHTGFTGTSLWIDLARRIYTVLLTNRVYPAAGPNEPMQQVRRSVHDAVIEAMTS